MGLYASRQGWQGLWRIGQGDQYEARLLTVSFVLIKLTGLRNKGLIFTGLRSRKVRGKGRERVRASLPCAYVKSLHYVGSQSDKVPRSLGNFARRGIVLRLANHEAGYSAPYSNSTRVKRDEYNYSKPAKIELIIVRCENWTLKTITCFFLGAVIFMNILFVDEGKYSTCPTRINMAVIWRRGRYLGVSLWVKRENPEARQTIADQLSRRALTQFSILQV